MTGTQCSLLPTGIMLEACALLETCDVASVSARLPWKMGQY